MSTWQHRLAKSMLVAFSLWMLICLVHASPALAQTAPPVQSQAAQKNILLLYSYGHGGKGVAIFDEGLTSTLSTGGIGANNLFFEYLDLERNRADQHYAAGMQYFLLQKYANRKIDLIIAVQQPARNFLLNEGRMIALGAPVITIQAAKVTEAEAGDRRFVSVLARFDIRGTLERALELFPQTQRVVFVSGSSEADQSVAAQAANIAASWQGKSEFEYSGELSMEVMLQRVASLPPRSIIIFTQYNRDSGGRTTFAYEVEALVAKAANAPVFGLYDFNLRNGGIGGSVVSVEGLGEKTGHVALDLLHGKLQLTQPVTSIDTEIVPMFDWRQIERWGGDTGRLPKNSVFLNRSPTMWEQYARYVIWIAVLVVAQFLLIAILIVNKRRRTLAEKLLRESEARFRDLTELSSDFYWETDIDHRLAQRTESHSGTRGSVFHQESPIGQCRWEIPYLSPDEPAWQAHRAVLDAHLPFRDFAFSRLAADGTERHVSISGDPVFDAAGNFEGYRGVGADITERKRIEAQVRQMAFYDTLTNLPNRRLLNDRLSQAIAASKRSGCYGALLFLDLDDFKLLNDTCGHEVGDLLLIEAADRLKSCVREMDTVSRFGGDEFVVMINEIGVDESESTTQAGIIAEKIRAALAKPYALKIQHEGKAKQTVEHHCTASIGIALFVKDEASQEDILRWADTAMYQAKEAGCNLIRFYESKALVTGKAAGAEG